MSKFLFVHIPKTGGTSIKRTLDVMSSDHWRREEKNIHHDTINELLEKNTISLHTKIFSVVRNPFERTVSYYHHFNRLHRCNISFETFLNIIENKIKTVKTPKIIYTQSYYVTDKFNSVIVDNIFKYEQFDEIEKFLGAQTYHLNDGQYDKKNALSLYTENTISKVLEIYNDDFVNFNYSKNIADAYRV